MKMEAAHSDLSSGLSSSAPPPSKSSGTEASISANNSSTKITPPLPPRLPPHIGIRTLNHIFTYEELVSATEQFAETNLLGEGGFGYVHKGVLPDGREVAVKQLKPRSWQGEKEFQAELDVISRVHHRNLVSLIGYCIHDEKRLLVYEFVPNNTLDFHLHEKRGPYLDWSMRMRIAIGSAKGLAYLHEDCDPKIVHRDVKAANILLNNAFEAKVSDFGLAKFFPDAHTHVTTRILGTLGYLAPEYASSGKLTEKSDVFSYGIILLELITGQRPTSVTCDPTGDGLLDWSRPLLVDALEKDDYKSLTDPRLESNYDHNQMKRMVTCAAACVRQSSRLRPRISEVVRVLEGAVTLQGLSAGISSG